MCLSLGEKYKNLSKENAVKSLQNAVERMQSYADEIYNNVDDFLDAVRDGDKKEIYETLDLIEREIEGCGEYLYSIKEMCNCLLTKVE